MSSMDIRDMDNVEITNKVHEWFLELEKVVPNSWIVQFGQLSEFRKFVDDIVYEYNDLEETVDEERKEREKAEQKLEDIQEAIKDISNDLCTIPDIEVAEDGTHNAGIVESNIQEIIKKLDDIADED